MGNKTTMNDLKDHLFDVIERVKYSTDPDADPKDIITLEAAQTIVDVAKVIVDVAKTEVQALNILSRADNPDRSFRAAVSSGLIQEHTPVAIPEGSSTKQ